MSPEPPPPRVFISYAHDTASGHNDRVLALSEQLREDGIDTILDQYIQAPPEGWQRWMLNQVDSADFILLISTDSYCQRFEGRATPGQGRGVTREGTLIDQDLYDHNDRNERFIPVLLQEADQAHIPRVLRPPTSYAPHKPDGYERLYRPLIPSCDQRDTDVEWAKEGSMATAHKGPDAATEELRHLLRTVRSKADHERVLCVWLREVLGLHSGDSATALGGQPSSVRRVQARYRQHGAAALRGVGRGGRRHALLSVDQETRLRATVARVAGDGGVAEASRGRAAYETAVGHVVPQSTVCRLLARHGGRKLVPRPRQREADPAAQQAFKKTCAVLCVPRCGGRRPRAARCG